MGSITYDPDTNLVMAGTGNGGPWPEELRQSKGLDNLFIASVVAVDADTGSTSGITSLFPAIPGTSTACSS